MKFNLYYYFISIIFSIILTSCGSGEIKDVSFKNDVQPILNEYCLQCHSGADTQGNIHLDSYKRMMESRYFNNPNPIAIPGKPEQSRLYIVVNSNNTGVRMPPESFGYGKLDESDIKIIKTWIAEGAKNN